MESAGEFGGESLPTEQYLEAQQKNTDTDTDRRKRTCTGNTCKEQYGRNECSQQTGNEIDSVRWGIASVNYGHDEIEDIQRSCSDRENEINTPESPTGDLVPNQTKDKGNDSFIQNTFRNIPPFTVTDVHDEPGTDDR